MFNKKWKKILFWTLSVIVVLGVGGLFAANYAVDKLMSSMADGFDVEADSTTDNETQGEVVVDTPVTVGEATVEPTVTPEPDATAQSTITPISTDVTTSQATEDVSDIAGQASAGASKPSSTPEVDGYTAQVSTDKAKQIQESVTVKDKADVASIVMSQLSLSDIKRLQELASGGLNIEEKREARSIILGKVSEEQYNELSQVAKKYGVSQGKTQDQIITEEEQLKAQEEGSE